MVVSMNNTRQTKSFFERWQTYGSDATGGCKELYENIRMALEPRLTGDTLDVGNGGVFSYDTSVLRKVVSVDLAKTIPGRPRPANVFFGQGDARALPFLGRTFDRVVLQLVIHHLAEETPRETDASVKRCLDEAFRVLRPGGKILVIESCVSAMLESLEDVLYSGTKVVARIIRHPMVKQFSIASLRGKLQDVGFASVAARPVELGPSVIQFGVMIPSVFSPVHVVLLEGTKTN